MKKRLASAAVSLALVACGPDRPAAIPFQAELVTTQAALADAPGVADESGGGMFLTRDGAATRLRLDGTRAALEPHPWNAAALGKPRALWPMGPHSALVSAEGGLFVAQGGWMIAPAWRASLNGEGIVATANGNDGTAWVAHQTGLFRLADGALFELKLGGESITGITSLVAAPAEDGASGVWFARGDELSVGVAKSKTEFTVRPSSLSVKNIRALVSLTPSSTARGEVWVVTDRLLHRRAAESWYSYDLGGTVDQVMSAGRIIWARVGSRLLRYEADGTTATVQASSDPFATGKWQEAGGVPGESPLLLGVDASGSAWVKSGDDAFCISRGRIPRLVGLTDAMKLDEDSVIVQARFPPGPEPTSVVYHLQSGEEVTANPPAYSLGGEEADGRLRGFPLTGLPGGLYTLGATAVYMDGSRARRSLTFEYRPLSTQTYSFAKDILPISEARCAKCHTVGPGRTLNTFESWTAGADLVVAAIRDQRMPADGPLDPALVLKIQRWVSGGMQP